jgi:methyltransferase (TIGR00027 family)
MESALINHVSDTALWIAAYRAQETDRADAVFKDPLAKKLAGQRGYEIAAAMPHTKAMAFAMIVRTVAIDRLIGIAVASGVDTVINLGAGLDTRPYRMVLPAALNWIEVDFEHLVQYKNELLAQEKPVCRLQRIPADLANDIERRLLLARLGAQTTKALVITEGVIGYLTNDHASRLSYDIHAIPSFRYWIQDYSRGKMRKNRQSGAVAKKLKLAPLQFQVSEPIKFFGEHGWKVYENKFILDEADSIGRRLPLMFPWSMLMFLFPKKIRAIGNKTYGYVMFEKA